MIDRIIRTWASDAVALAHALAANDPTWGTTTAPIADGWLVLSGRGLYVNRLIGAGRRRPLTDDDLDELERRSELVGVPAAVEQADDVSWSREVLETRGYAPVSAVSVGVRPIGSHTDRHGDGGSAFEMTVVTDAADLREWQDSAAQGWGHVDDGPRRASDAFAAAARAVAGSSLIIVRDVGDGRPVATCSLQITDGMATLGGMSVIPSERRRGAQRACLDHRVRLAAAAGCDVAATSTEIGGDSARNVARHGFADIGVIRVWQKNSVPDVS